MKTSVISSIIIKVRVTLTDSSAEAEGTEGKPGGEITSKRTFADSHSSETVRSVALKLFFFFLVPCFLVIPCQITAVSD